MNDDNKQKKLIASLLLENKERACMLHNRKKCEQYILCSYHHPQGQIPPNCSLVEVDILEDDHFSHIEI